jgi:hypothetical protein
MMRSAPSFTVLSHPELGVANQLVPLSTVFDDVPKPERVMQWLNHRRGGPPLLRELALRAHEEPITHELLDSYPPGYALHRLRDLFVHAGILEERSELLDRIEPWLDRVLGERPQHHATVVRSFAVWHALRRARQRARRVAVTTHAATYVRTQITITLEFLSWLDDHGKTLATVTQGDLDLWLDSGSQTNYFLKTFLSWAAGRGLCDDLSVPNRPRADPAVIVEEDDRWSMLRRCLRDGDLPIDVRAAGVLVLLYGRTTTSFAALTVADLHHIDGESYLRFDEVTVLLPPAAAAVFHSLRAAATSRETFHRQDSQARFLFPGRSPGRPAAAFVLARKLRTHGIFLLPSRHSARAAWARDLPAAIAADLFGTNISTATRWASRTRRDWTDYLAARADNRRALP